MSMQIGSSAIVSNTQPALTGPAATACECKMSPAVEGALRNLGESAAGHAHPAAQSSSSGGGVSVANTLANLADMRAKQAAGSCASVSADADLAAMAAMARMQAAAGAGHACPAAQSSSSGGGVSVANTSANLADMRAKQAEGSSVNVYAGTNLAAMASLQAAAAAADNSGQRPMTERDALQSFLNNPPPDGAVLNQAAMQGIANSNGPQKQAAQYFLDHPSAYNAMQSANERSKGNFNSDYDGKFVKDDMIARLKEINGGQGATTLATGNAATYAATATAAGARAEAAGAVAGARAAAAAGAAGAYNSGQPTMTERDALQSFLNNAEGGGVANQSDLVSIANGNSPQKQAAQYYLDHPAAYNAMQSAQKRHDGKFDDSDGKFSKNDLISRLNELPV